MNPIESALTFECGSEQLLGILTRPTTPSAEIGVLILVGGPQYRVGSHRQFLLLARQLARNGFSTLRFDYRGMGDSSGNARSFEDVDEDIAAALATFQVSEPTMRQFVLWGLCDAASAALLYWQRTKDPRITGLCLLNPWVRSHETLARAQVKHYYLQRLLQRAFWLKLFRGGVAVLPSVREFLQKLAQLFKSGDSVSRSLTFQQQMGLGLGNFRGEVLLILSGQDLTAQEFIEHATHTPDWQGFLGRTNIRRQDIPSADHTFSSAAWRSEVENTTIAWLNEKFPSAKIGQRNTGLPSADINHVITEQPTENILTPSPHKIVNDAK